MQLEPPAAMADSHEIENLWIPLSDGCRLAARLFLPAGQATPPAPAILEYIPYRKRDFMRRRDESIHRWFAAQGYAAVRVDLRGSGESDGIMHDEYLKQELDDAVEVIAWIAAQPWCTGKVGMMGKSWGAYNSVQVAALRPPALKAIIAAMGTDDRYAECIHYSGGCLMLDNFWWGCIMQIFNARPPDPAIVGESWREAWLARLEAETFWPEIWLQHQTLDDYWKHGSVSFDYAAIICPTWFWGGWADLYRDTPFRLAEHLQAPHRVTVGPWAHLYPHEGVPKPAVGFLQEALRWWDRWLRDEPNDVMAGAPFQFYLMDSVPPQASYAERPGRWVGESRWPSANVQLRRLALNDRRLEAVPQPEVALTVCSPQTLGLAGGEWAASRWRAICRRIKPWSWPARSSSTVHRWSSASNCWAMPALFLRSRRIATKRKSRSGSSTSRPTAGRRSSPAAFSIWRSGRVARTPRRSCRIRAIGSRCR